VKGVPLHRLIGASKRARILCKSASNWDSGACCR
jgi:hypothetical protein